MAEKLHLNNLIETYEPFDHGARVLTRELEIGDQEKRTWSAFIAHVPVSERKTPHIALTNEFDALPAGTCIKTGLRLMGKTTYYRREGDGWTKLTAKPF